MLLLVETLGFLAPSPCSDVRAKTTRIAVLEYRSIDTLMG
jgi:microcompartment protein CcmL/EutN